MSELESLVITESADSTTEMSSSHDSKTDLEIMQEQYIFDNFESLIEQGTDPFALDNVESNPQLLYEDTPSQPFASQPVQPSSPSEGASHFQSAYYTDYQEETFNSESSTPYYTPDYGSPAATSAPNNSTNPFGRYSVKAGVCQHHLYYSDTLPWSTTGFDFDKRYCDDCQTRNGLARGVAAIDIGGDLAMLDFQALEMGSPPETGESPFMDFYDAHQEQPREMDNTPIVQALDMGALQEPSMNPFLSGNAIQQEQAYEMDDTPILQALDVETPRQPSTNPLTYAYAIEQDPAHDISNMPMFCSEGFTESPEAMEVDEFDGLNVNFSSEEEKPSFLSDRQTNSSESDGGSPEYSYLSSDSEADAALIEDFDQCSQCPEERSEDPFAAPPSPDIGVTFSPQYLYVGEEFDE